MKPSHRKKIIRYLFLISIIGFGFGSLALSNADIFKQVGKSQKLITDVYYNLLTRYVDQIDVEAFTKTSIQNMLGELDPYTVYMENDEREGLDVLTRGKYGGVGIQLGKRENQLTVIAPMDDSPAQRAGILSGDIITAIDSITTKDIDLEDAARKIRGSKGTTVILTIARPGVDKPLDFSLVRDDIRINDVTYAGMLTPTTGYIRLTRFSKNSGPETRSALQTLTNKGMQALILDLRDNPGGLLQSAIEILDLFVPKGELLLTTKGRNKDANQSFYAQADPLLDKEIRIVVLVNGGSASASEIVAGTLQDLDRGVIMGTRSFGKGLVQTVYNLDPTRAIKLTTAKYYTPSGRLIQKPDYNNKRIIAWSAPEDSVFATQGGRRVSGGGGIKPDINVKNDPVSPLSRECWRQGYFFSFVQQNQHRFTTESDIVIDQEVFDQFKQFLKEKNVKVTLPGEHLLEESKQKLVALDSTDTGLLTGFSRIEAFLEQHKTGLPEEERQELEMGLKMEFANQISGSAGRVKMSLERDTVVKSALELLDNKASYQDIFVAKK